MRGLALFLTVAAGVALLAACDGSSGTGFQSGVATASIDRIAFTSNTQEQNGIYPLSLQEEVALAKQVPLTLNAAGFHGAGADQTIVEQAAFTWTAAYSTTCASGKPTHTGAIQLDFIDPNDTGTPDPYHFGYSYVGTTQQVASVALFPQVVTPAPGSTSTPTVDYPVGFPIPTAAPSATPTASPAAASASYCVTLAAHAADGTTGTANVIVSYP
ncbi:MAG TPA: hypothetical protein VME66_05235 [Candidatus Acidoferrales bacterium]|nr:hypothetical protein [Candidatus Acidoferrales bacterium]